MRDFDGTVVQVLSADGRARRGMDVLTARSADGERHRWTGASAVPSGRQAVRRGVPDRARRNVRRRDEYRHPLAARHGPRRGFSAGTWDYDDVAMLGGGRTRTPGATTARATRSYCVPGPDHALDEVTRAAPIVRSGAAILRGAFRPR